MTAGRRRPAPGWHDLAAFNEDIESSIGPRPPGRYPGGVPLYSLDRTDPDGDHQPGKARCATVSEQARNRRKRQADTPPQPGPIPCSLGARIGSHDEDRDCRRGGGRRAGGRRMRHQLFPVLSPAVACRRGNWIASPAQVTASCVMSWMSILAGSGEPVSSKAFRVTGPAPDTADGYSLFDSEAIQVIVSVTQDADVSTLTVVWYGAKRAEVG